MKDWSYISADGYETLAEQIRSSLIEGEVKDALYGIEALIEDLSQEKKDAAQSLLALMMTHIIKWHLQPDRRSVSWEITIKSSRRNLHKIMGKKPSINRRFLEEIWQDAFDEGFDLAAADMNIPTRQLTAPALSWEQVMEQAYEL